jgi:AcrR family transcriptional regulator
MVGPNARERQILDVALRLFSERGYRETSLKDIADVLGITRPAFYYYFRSKEDILWRIIEDLGFSLLDRARPVAERPGTPEQRLRAIVEAHVRALLRHPAAFRVYFSERSSLDPERDARLRAGEHAYTHVIADVIREGQRAGVFRDGDAVVDALFVTGLGNSIVRWYRPDGRLGADELARHTAGAALRMLAPA